MTARKDTKANCLIDWAAAAKPGESYVYYDGPSLTGKTHDRVFGAARKLQEEGQVALFTSGRKKIARRISGRAGAFLDRAARL